MSFDVLELSMSVKDATVANIHQANKAIKKLQSNPSKIVFPRIGPKECFKLMTFADASHGNLCDGVSSGGGFLVVLVGQGNLCFLGIEEASSCG